MLILDHDVLIDYFTQSMSYLFDAEPSEEWPGVAIWEKCGEDGLWFYDLLQKHGFNDDLATQLIVEASLLGSPEERIEFIDDQITQRQALQ